MTTVHWPYPHVVAHRGGGLLAPENTVAGIVSAAFFGQQMVEFDVKLSRDGVAFLLHDDTLDRTTDGTGPARDWDWAELAELDAGSWFDPRFEDEPLPTLKDAALACLDHGLAANVEIKPCPGREAETGRLVALECARLWARSAHKPLLSSFSTVALQAARAEVPDLSYGWLVDGALPADWRAQARALGVAAIDLVHTLLTPALVADIHAEGLAVLAWTLNEPTDTARLLGWGVDSVCTDAIDRVQP